MCVESNIWVAGNRNLVSCAEQRLWGSLCCNGNMWRRVFFDVRKTRQINDFFSAVLSEMVFFCTTLLLLCFLIVGIHSSGISIPLSLFIYMNCLFDFARVVIRVTINKFYFVPEWFVSSFVSMLWIGWDLGTGESDVSIVLFNSALRRSSSPSDVHLAAFSGNPVNYAILFSRVDSVFWSY